MFYRGQNNLCFCFSIYFSFLIFVLYILKQLNFHSHPLSKDENGNSVSSMKPSSKKNDGIRGDVDTYGKDGPNDSPSFILGYDVTQNTPSSQIGGTGRTSEDVTKQISFYNGQGPVGKPIDYKKFTKTVKAINDTK